MLKKILYTFLWLSIMAAPAYSAPLKVACAANFTGAMKELAGLFEKDTGTHVDCTFGSTGMLYGQIKNGAPYDLFFAADKKRPALLFDEGIALEPTVYAKGKVVLWTSKKALAEFTDWKSLICDKCIVKVGIATPKTAPYGLRATEAMSTAKVFGKTEPKLAYGKSVGVAFQFAYSGAADVSFVALSQALSAKGKGGTYWTIPEAQAVNQAACVLRQGQVAEAKHFLNWLHTADAQAVVHKFGYE